VIHQGAEPGAKCHVYDCPVCTVYLVFHGVLGALLLDDFPNASRLGGCWTLIQLVRVCHLSNWAVNVVYKYTAMKLESTVYYDKYCRSFFRQYRDSAGNVIGETFSIFFLIRMH